MREPGGRRRRERGGAYQIGRLAVFALIVIVLVVVLLQLLDCSNSLVRKNKGRRVMAPALVADMLPVWLAARSEPGLPTVSAVVRLRAILSSRILLFSAPHHGP